LLSVSDKLTKLPGEITQSYVARQANGKWFVWEDNPPETPATVEQ
jgi:hypothetical protein